MKSALHWIEAGSDPDDFPPVASALESPNGLLAAGGDLSEERLLCAYRRGIFPWFDSGQPVLWWSPNPRTVLFADEFHCSKSLVRSIRRRPLSVSFNQAFDAVIDACSEPRPHQNGTWITAEMRASYCALFDANYGFSVEVWEGASLVGGLYGVCVARMLFGESMFSRTTDASKVALLALTSRMQAISLPVLDCQVRSAHLISLGAKDIPRATFGEMLKSLCAKPQAAADKLTGGAKPALNFLN